MAMAMARGGGAPERPAGTICCSMSARPCGCRYACGHGADTVVSPLSRSAPKRRGTNKTDKPQQALQRRRGTRRRTEFGKRTKAKRT